MDGLKDLCSRNPNIPKVYSKCARGAPRMEHRSATHHAQNSGRSPPAAPLSPPTSSLSRCKPPGRPPRLEHSRAPHAPTHRTQPHAGRRRSSPPPSHPPLLLLPPPPPPQLSRRRPPPRRTPDGLGISPSPRPKCRSEARASGASTHRAQVLGAHLLLLPWLDLPACVPPPPPRSRGTRAPRRPPPRRRRRRASRRPLYPPPTTAASPPLPTGPNAPQSRQVGGRHDRLRRPKSRKPRARAPRTN